MFMVFESSLNGKNKSGLKFFFFFYWAMNWAQALNGACGTRGFEPREKTRYPKRAGFGPRVLPCGLGPGMEKPGPNSTRSHSYL